MARKTMRMPSQPSEKPWRARVAMDNLGLPLQYRCAVHNEVSKDFQNLLQDHWESIRSSISALESSDTVFKAEALHRLSLFLMCVAPTSTPCFTCPDAFTIVTHFGSKGIVLRVEDIQRLHNLLFAQLTNYPSWLFSCKGDACDSKSTEDLKDFLSGSNGHVRLAVCVKTLQCCIRILPLLEFHTGLSFHAAKTLTAFLEQLCCSENICQLIEGDLNYPGCQRDGSGKLRNNLIEPKFCGNFTNEDDWFSASASCICPLEECIKSLQLYGMKISAFCFPPKDVIGSDINDTNAVIDSAQMACTLLEVFMDELLSQPGLADVLATPDMNPNLELYFNGNSLNEKHVVLSIQAAVAHFIISFSKCNRMGLSTCSFYSMNLEKCALGLTLPAAVMLFDLTIADVLQVTDPFLLHVISVLSRSLEFDSCLVAQLHKDMVLSLAVSVLESAMSLYSRLWRPVPAPAFWYEPDFDGLVTPLKNMLLSKVRECGDRCNKKILLAFEGSLNGNYCSHEEQVSLQEGLMTHTAPCFVCVANSAQMQECRNNASNQSSQFLGSGSQSENVAGMGSTEKQQRCIHSQCCTVVECTSLVPNASLHVSVLQLIGASLHRINIEAGKYEAGFSPVPLVENDTSNTSDDCFLHVGPALYINLVEKVFKICVSKDHEKTLNKLRGDIPFGKLLQEGEDAMGHALAFFIERLIFELEQGSPKVLQEAYWNVLKSVTNLLIFSNCRRGGLNTENHSAACKDLQVEVTHNVKKETNMEQALERSCLTEVMHDSVAVRSTTLLIMKKFKEKYDRISHAKKQSRPDVTGVKDVKNCGDRSEVTAHKSLQKQTAGSCRWHLNNSSPTKGRNAYIEEVLRREGQFGESFEDLEDFIVCKKGRDYCTWMKIHWRKRRKKLCRSYWRRLKEKRALKALLSRTA